MAGHSHLRLPAEEPGDFGAKTLPLASMAKVAGAAGLVIALVMGFLAKDQFRQFYFAYLAALGYFLAIALGALFFVLVHHLTRAGWSVNVRRVAENLAALLPVLGVLSLPIFVSVLIQKGDLYRWALPPSAAETAHEGQSHGGESHEAHPHADVPVKAHDGAEKAGEGAAASSVLIRVDDTHEADPGSGNRKLDELTLTKRAWLNPYFFAGRLLAYFLIWTVIASFYLKRSVRQDADGDYRHSVEMQKYSAIALVLFGITLTLAAFDLFMSLDPHWYSTMFGVYYFAGGVVCFFATMIVVITLMQRVGYLREAVTTEHFHDLGKYMFAFVFFWGYITFSQYMLLWYASIPEEVTWPARRGMTTGGMSMVPGFGAQWQAWALVVLFGCLLIPFPGLMSRHMKRNRAPLVFWAIWLLVFHFINMLWIVLPEQRVGLKVGPVALAVLAAIGIGGVLVAAWLRVAGRHKVRPVNDPRVYESAAFVNI